jgi:excisionase family DNA binding protein
VTATWTLEQWETGQVPPCLTVLETASVLGVCTYTVYQLIKRGDLPTVVHRTPIRIPTVAVRRMIGLDPSTQSQ